MFDPEAFSLFKRVGSDLPIDLPVKNDYDDEFEFDSFNRLKFGHYYTEDDYENANLVDDYVENDSVVNDNSASTDIPIKDFDLYSVKSDKEFYDAGGKCSENSVALVNGISKLVADLPAKKQTCDNFIALFEITSQHILHRIKCRGCSNIYLHRYVVPLNHFICQFGYDNSFDYRSTADFVYKNVHNLISTGDSNKLRKKSALLNIFDQLEYNIECRRVFLSLKNCLKFSESSKYVPLNLFRCGERYANDFYSLCVWPSYDFPIDLLTVCYKYYFYAEIFDLLSPYIYNITFGVKDNKLKMRFASFRTSKFN
jgi:hypothetical protein